MIGDRVQDGPVAGHAGAAGAVVAQQGQPPGAGGAGGAQLFDGDQAVRAVVDDDDLIGQANLLGPAQQAFQVGGVIICRDGKRQGHARNGRRSCRYRRKSCRGRNRISSRHGAVSGMWRLVAGCRASR